jgi:hypothetical protein
MLLNYVPQSIRGTRRCFAVWLGGFAEITFCPICGELFVSHGGFPDSAENLSREQSSRNSNKKISGMNFAGITQDVAALRLARDINTVPKKGAWNNE